MPLHRRASLALTVTIVTACAAAPAHAAWQAGGTGGPSVPASSLPAGATPSVGASGQNVTVSWSAASMGSAVLSYQVRRYNTSNVVQTIGAACASTTNALTCTEATVGVGSWKYTVTPVYATWTGTESPKSATVTTPPLAPTGVSASATSSSAITVSWSAAAGATGYEVYRGTTPGGPYSLISSPAGTSYGDSCLASGTPFYYVVKATFGGAASSQSGEATTTTQAAAIPNGNFEAGSLSSWTGIGGAVSVQTSFDGFTAHGCSYFGLVEAGTQSTYAHLTQSFSATAGQTISGWAFFDGKDYSPYLDDGAVVIQQNGTDVATVFAASIGTLGDYGRTGWTHWTYTVPSSGTYSVDARVENIADSGQPSYVGIDDVVVQ